ncbi:MAG: heme o synthase [Phycisphaerae bacterium]|nr:heme o synthase [Phycisphaerae bacterium]
MKSAEPIESGNGGAVSLTASLAAAGSRIADFIEMTKPRIAALVLITTAVGYALGARSTVALLDVLHVVLGTALAAAGANALNQVLEWRFDALMRRTAVRPIPSGRVEPIEGLLFGLLCAASGIAYLAVFSNHLAALATGVCVVSYVLLYTPLKRVSPWCTVVGAVPGALPPVIGWSAARGTIEAEIAVVFAIMFVWQIPHFWSIAWMYRHEYGAAGFAMLSVVDQDGRRTSRQVVVLSIVLVGLSVLPWCFATTGSAYLVGALLLGSMFVAAGAHFALRPTHATARQLLRVSIIYLPLLLGLMMIDP